MEAKSLNDIGVLAACTVPEALCMVPHNIQTLANISRLMQNMLS